MARLAAQPRDERDAAGVVLVSRVVQTDRLGRPLAWRQASAPEGRGVGTGGAKVSSGRGARCRAGIGSADASRARGDGARGRRDDRHGGRRRRPRRASTPPRSSRRCRRSPACPGLRARTLGGWPGVHVGAADALEIARAAAAEAAAGRGVVLTHGTDTLEETAVLCDLLHGGDAPIVVTGAIRPASATGADGPANLLDAVRAAGDAATAGLGALVAFAGELHAARAVRKSDSVSPRAFSSRSRGPLGRVAEESVEVWSRPGAAPAAAGRAARRARGDRRRRAWAATARWSRPRSPPAPTASSPSCWAPATRRPRSWPPAARPRAACRSWPACGRSRAAILRGTYGFEGAERDVRAAGLILAPALSPAAARITLMACLGAGYSTRRDCCRVRAVRSVRSEHCPRPPRYGGPQERDGRQGCWPSDHRNGEVRMHRMRKKGMLRHARAPDAGARGDDRDGRAATATREYVVVYERGRQRRRAARAGGRGAPAAPIVDDEHRDRRRDRAARTSGLRGQRRARRTSCSRAPPRTRRSARRRTS